LGGWSNVPIPKECMGRDIAHCSDRHAQEIVRRIDEEGYS
jgi:hypothetical protein